MGKDLEHQKIIRCNSYNRITELKLNAQWIGWEQIKPSSREN